MSVMPPGRRSSSPRRRAGWSAAARAAICSSGTSKCRATAVAARILARLPAPEEPRVEPHGAGRRAHVGGGAVEPAIFDRSGLHVGARVNAERHDAAGERADARRDPRIVRVGDEDVCRARLFEHLGLGVGDLVAGREEPEVRVADVRPDADVGLRDAHQRPDLAAMIHTELDHCHLRSRPQLEERERQADVVVQVPLVPEHAVPGREELRNDFLRRRLARAAGDGDHPRARSPPDVACQVLQAARRVVHFDDGWPAGGPVACRPWHLAGSLDEGPARAARQRLRDEAMTVEALAANGDEEVPVARRPRVDRDPVNRLPVVSPYEMSAGGGRDVPGSQR